MILVNGYSKSTPTRQTKQFNHFSPIRAEIRDFLHWLHRLADGLDGELVLVAIEQEPDEAKAQVRVRRFGVGDSTAMAEAALEEAKKDWVNVYFGSYVVRPGLPSNCSWFPRRHHRRADAGRGSRCGHGPRGAASLGAQPRHPDLAGPDHQSSGLLCL